MSTTTNANEGMKLLEESKFDDAITYFSNNLSDHVSYYGLASAKFRKNPSEISNEELLIVIELYEKSIELSPDFADSFYMCGMAYSKLTTNMVLAFKSDPDLATEKNLNIAVSSLAKYREYINMSVKLNPGFKEIAIKEAETFSILSSAIESYANGKDQ